MSETQLQDARNRLEEVGKVYSEACSFSEYCNEDTCQSVDAQGILMTADVIENESVDEPATLSNGYWFGPIDSSEATRTFLYGQSTVILPSYGDRLGILSLDRATGNARLTLHGTTEHIVESYIGTCEVQG
ncbi:hypothetical protein [uncultured Roseobacter sp.]|uniref:hypothetical protein n=1 Tax=uncultured Roseobacter sp. TaxID=114847 RepID=UPI002635B0FF|nr:hypothetical protein [uncultured Roseobacter sp.]